LSKNLAEGENVNLSLCWKNGVRGAKDKGNMVIYKLLINLHEHMRTGVKWNDVRVVGWNL
jgi:hypothetical protein